jgi:hypothetical protein
MNEIDLLTRFRDTVPLDVTPRAARLFHAALREEDHTERRVAAPRRNPLAQVRRPWRLGVAVSAAAALAAGLAAAVLVQSTLAGSGPPDAPAVLTAKLLADRASAAALTEPTVSPGQWVYRVVESNQPIPGGGRKTVTSFGWETADGGVTYGDGYSAGVAGGDTIPSYSQLGSLPDSPADLDAYLAKIVYPNSNPTPVQRDQAAFSVINDMLINYVLPPALEAEVYQALAAIPIVTVDGHVTTIDGQVGVAFVLPVTPQSERQEIILDATSYRFLGWASWVDPASPASMNETAVTKTVLVGAPGSTEPSLTPPTPAELLAEQADRAVTYVSAPPRVVRPETWVLRELATPAGRQTVWATADDSAQASYVGGSLQVCDRSAACAKSTQWLMPAGPSYTLVNPPALGSPHLPQSLPQLLAALNAYPTGCSDVTGDCNAVNAVANMIAGYLNRGGPDGTWFLMLADVPGVTVRQVTDVTGQADVAFSFTFNDGITEILLNASTHRFAGYLRDGAETVITKEVTVAGPGSYTPVTIRPTPAPVPFSTN